MTVLEDITRRMLELEGEVSRLRTQVTSGVMHMGGETSLTISSDAITVRPYAFYILTPQAGTTDDLSTINGGLAGKMIGLRVNDNANTITIKDGVDNISLPDGDVDLDHVAKLILLVYDDDQDVWILAGDGGGAGGATTFLALTDTPAGYGSHTLKSVRVNAGETGLEFFTPAAGASTFTALTDTPANYTGHASKYAAVNVGESALEFVTPGAANQRTIFDFLNSTKDSADTPDDEFDGGSLDPKWTVVNGSAVAMDFLGGTNVSNYEIDTDNDILQMQVGSNGSQVVNMRQDWTLGDGESIIAAFSPPTENLAGTSANNQHNIQIFLNDNDTAPSAGNYIYFSYDIDASAMRILFYDGSSLIGYTPTSGFPPPSTTYFFRWARSSLTYHAFWSLDGASWSYLGSKTPGSAYDNFWLQVNNAAAYSAPALITTWHWVRQGTNSMFPWSPLVTVPTIGGIRNTGSVVDVTLSSDTFAKPTTSSFVRITSEAGASDDLATITGGADGDELFLKAASGHTITAIQTGNLELSSNFTMDNRADRLHLHYDAEISKWCEVTSSGNA